MGDDDLPFSARQWGLGRRLVPSPRGRRGCMFMLLVGFAIFVVAIVFAVAVGGR